MASANSCFLHCSSQGTGVRLDISLSPVPSSVSPTCCVALGEEHGKLREELDELYKDYTVLQSDLQRRVEEGKEKEKRLLDLQGAVSEFISKGLRVHLRKRQETRPHDCSDRVDQSPNDSQTDRAELPPDRNYTEKLMSELDEIHRRVIMLEEENRVLRGLSTNGKGKEFDLSLSVEALSPDLGKVPQQCQSKLQSRKEDEVMMSEKKIKEMADENQHLHSSVEQAIMLAALWENRWRSCNEKTQRLEQCLQVLKQDQQNTEWDWRPWELNEGPDVRPVSSRFRKEVCQMAECQNCRRFFEGSEAEGDLCQYHTQRPLFVTEWQSLFPWLNHDAIMQYQDYRFWPCCGVLAKKTPNGCRVGQHVIKP
ncbi:uncharacterized protein LOC135470458 [Liolophura sinensis]|uniref:uncharacterized protein LOC135470458 n=1 Tax=Liolophura sinensis TaxID=3198878 RepID=UPI003158D8FD